MSRCSRLRNRQDYIIILSERYNCTIPNGKLSHINLETVDNFKTVENYAQMSVNFCKYEHKVWVYTGCLNTIRRTDGPLKEVRNLRSILTQLTRNEDEFIHARNKRGVNFIGGISKILFGTLDAEDASYYTDKISQVENEQLDFLKLSKEQMTVKSTLRSINSTLLFLRMKNVFQLV